VAVRTLVLVLGDQLDATSPAFAGFDPSQDVVLMAEVAAESTHVPSHKVRTALFLSAMRHFRDELRKRSWPVVYHAIEDRDNPGTLAEALAVAVERQRPRRVVCVEPGEYRVEQALRAACPTIEYLEDTHFLYSRAEFAAHARGRTQLRLEFFYREARRRFGILMDGAQPVGGTWNFDAENRGAFGPQGPPLHARPVRFPPCATTRQVQALVNERFADHPGSTEHFDWPVNREQSQAALSDFIRHRLPLFGQFQDAMWTDEPVLFHSRLSAALNLKLLHPREVITEAEKAYRDGSAPLAAVEGFIRQILGWREYVRGLYWLQMPGYAERNALDAHEPLPDFYWTGDTEMHCLRQSIGQTLEHGYAHHIQRLMVTGLYALLLGVEPRQVHEWYLAVYADAVEWVELPNTIGMSQFADGGMMASKPYCASGKYIQRMSNYCAGCRYDPAEATGPDACPFTTLYWDFLLRNEGRLRRIPRMSMQLNHLARLDGGRREEIAVQAQRLRLAAPRCGCGR
jgi:deoxyribodipyrimidine photolyase-related protein